jgi:hypothetical protein
MGQLANQDVQRACDVTRCEAKEHLTHPLYVRVRVERQKRAGKDESG